MRIEKINENQIRATLTKEDLESRHLRLSEFAYGTEAARTLFAELLRFASYKLGFEVDDTPLMIEAIPVAADSIVLIITKIPYPEELDTRFSRFSDAPDTDDFNDYYEEASYDPRDLFLAGKPTKASDIIDVSAVERDVAEEHPLSGADEGRRSSSEASAIGSDVLYTRMFAFHSIDDVFALARIVGSRYNGSNSLYHIRDEYLLVLKISEHTPEEYNRIVNIAAEFGSSRRYTTGSENYYLEHTRPIVAKRALQVLASI